MAASNKKNVTLKVADTEFNFAVGIAEFNSFQNEFLPNNKVAPSENFLTRCVKQEQREKLTELCDQGLAIDLAQMVAAEFKPEVKIEVKK